MIILCSILLLFGWLCWTDVAIAQSFYQLEESEYRPGLRVTYESDSARVERIDEDVLFNWEERPIDERFTLGDPFTARWSGLLQTKAEGRFTLSLYGAAGHVTVNLNGQEVISTELGDASWLSSEPIELSFGRQPIEITYRAAGHGARLGIYWSGPGFALEPIAPRYWVHRAENAPKQQFELGRKLARGLRCTACHRLGTSSTSPLAAPALTHLQGNLRPSWLVNHLRASPESSMTGDIDQTDEKDNAATDLSDRRMPYYGLHPNDAAAISAALFAASEASPNPRESIDPADLKTARNRQKSLGNRQQSSRRASGDAARGARLFASVGCVACHQVGQLGRWPFESDPPPAYRLFSGGDLSEISAKRTKEFFSRHLRDPAIVNSQHRMPAVQLEPVERWDLAAFLQNLGKDAARHETQAYGDPGRGAGLIARHRCAACHQLPPSLTALDSKTPISATSDWEGGCLTQPAASRAVPGFGLPFRYRQALKAYVVGLENSDRPKISPTPGLDGPQLLAENNCLNCHSREPTLGIAPHLPLVAEEQPDLAAELAGLSPPSLSGVGDKLRAEALRAAIKSEPPRLRPWLKVRMPKFELDQEQLQTLADYLIDHDRIPEPGGAIARPWDVDLPGDTASQLAAARLVTADGFGCQSCHAIGQMESPQVDLKARGTNLAMLSKRIRESWFHRWVRDPSRIVPRMEMPAIQQAIRGVLEDDLDLQLAALWKTLNVPDFKPPRPNPVRVVRNYNSPDIEGSVQVVTSVLETPAKRFLRPLVIGLPNRHNLLFDLESGNLAAWWIGDTARQHTRGKTWYWEPGSEFLNHFPQVLERVAVLGVSGKKWVARASGQVAVSLDSITRTANGIRWTGRLHLGEENAADSARMRQIPLSQRFEPAGNSAKVTTRLQMADGERVSLEASGPAILRGREAHVAVAPECELSIESDSADLSVSPEGRLLFEPLGDSGTVEWTSTYMTGLPPDRFVPPEGFTFQASPVRLDCVPGYEAIQLPLPRDEMPVSFAWGPQGEFYCGSLKGHVLQLHDDNGDGLHERYEIISDQFPTPYGMQATDEGLDVLTKFALMRLTPGVRPGLRWDAEVVADGWGYTADYHDWAVGLELDDAGNYYLALPCQQDDRSEAAAYLRGAAVKLVPDVTSLPGNRLYRLEPFAAGLRFPMGIALSPSGDLFTTDNQGNYNPFNELNHLRKGKRYGFINKLENKDGFSPPFESPAINLPHPWTRSVNGICFLLDPNAVSEHDSVRAGAPNSVFGPFEGHLIGCEMNGRALIRMSLQRVGDTYQGAAYLFSRPGGEPTFEGPIVCELSPTGDLYVGNLHDSGWGGGNNTGSIVRLKPTGDLPLGIAEVRATPTGFEINFTDSVDRDKALQLDNYELRSYRRVSTPAYGGEDQDVRNERVQHADLSNDGRQLNLHLDSLRAGFVYEINVGRIGQADATLFPNQAHYTLRSIPKD